MYSGGEEVLLFLKEKRGPLLNLPQTLSVSKVCVMSLLPLFLIGTDRAVLPS